MFEKKITEIGNNQNETSPELCFYFERVVNFIQWSSVQDQSLRIFEHMLQHEIKVSKEELNFILSNITIDYELARCLLKLCDQIQFNLLTFYQEDTEGYFKKVESKAVGKVCILFRNSSKQVKLLCNLLIFLHFSSCSMGHYNKIILWFREKALFFNLNDWDDKYSCIIKHKILTVISILYIKYDQTSENSHIIEACVVQRQKYGKIKKQNSLIKSTIKKSFSSISNNSVYKNKAQIIQNWKNKSEMKFETMSLFLRIKIIDQMMLKKKINLGNSPLSNQAKKVNQQSVINADETAKYYQVLTLIHKYLGEIKQKLFIQGLEPQIQYFQDRMNHYLNICDKKLKEYDFCFENQYQKCEDDLQLVLASRLFNQVRNNTDLMKQSRSKSSNLQTQCKSRQKQQISMFRLSEKKESLNQILSKKFFKSNEKFENGKQKSKSAKLLSRGKSKSKIMAKILSNTFENAKNALRQIEFEMKTNNFDRFINKRLINCKQLQSSKVLAKKKKTKEQIYQKLNQNKLLSANVCSKKLMEELKNLKKIIICNPLMFVEQNKRCIIDHLVSQREQSQIEQQEKVDDIFKSEIQSKLEFIKYIGGTPTILVVRIKPKDKTYILSVNLMLPGNQQFTIQICLPKSNNIFIGRYHTIWPTVKYLLRKKILQSHVVKQNEDWVMEYKAYSLEQRHHLQTCNEAYIQMFGIIDEDELLEICTTLALLSKFVDLIIFKSRTPVGTILSVCDLGNDLSLCLPPVTKISTFNIFSKKKKSYQSFHNMKQNILLGSGNRVYIAAHIIQRRLGKLEVLNSFASNFPFFLLSIETKTQNIKNIILGASVIDIQIRLYALEAKRDKTNNISRSKFRKKVNFEQIQIKPQKQVYYQKIVISNHELQFLHANIGHLKQAILQDIFSYKFHRHFQDYIMQLTWLKFSLHEDFYIPFFFHTNISPITYPNQCQIDSDGPVNLKTPSTNQDFSVKICQNFLQFNLDDISHHFSGRSFGKHFTNKTIGFHRKTQNLQSKKALRIVRRMPSIQKSDGKQSSNKISNVTDAKKIYRTVRQPKSQQQIIKYFSIVQNEKCYIQLKFLTFFSPLQNWIVEISKVSLEKLKKDSITLSAKDLYLLGFPLSQSSTQILKSIQFICKSLEICRNTRIPKVVISVKGMENSNLSVDEGQSGRQPPRREQNQKMSLHSQKFRSIYLSKRYMSNSIYHNKSESDTNGYQTQHDIKAILRESFCKIRRRFSNKQMITRMTKQIGKNKRLQLNSTIKKDYLVQICDRYWYLATFPIKLQVKNNKHNYSIDKSPTKENKTRSCQLLAYQLIQLKFFTQQKIGVNCKSDFFQFQISISQTQYSIVCQISSTQLVQLLQEQYKSVDIGLIEAVDQFIHNGNATTHQINKNIKSISRRSSLKQKSKYNLKNLGLSISNPIYKTQGNDHEQTYVKNPSAAIIEKLNKNCTSRIKTRDESKTELKKIKTYFASILSKVKIHYAKQNTLNLGIKNINQSAKCIQRQSFHDRFGYELVINKWSLPMKIRLYQQYDQIKQCLYDVYLHSNNWKVGFGVNEGIGLGAEVQISKISIYDHLQLVQINFSKEKSIKRQRLNETYLRMTGQCQKQQKLRNSQSQNSERSEIFREVSKKPVLQLIKQYKLDHVDPICQMQPDLYTKSTIELINIAKYMVKVQTNFSLNTQCVRS